MHPGVRAGAALYALLLRLMPRSFRERYGHEAVEDVREMLRDAHRFQGDTVVGTALRACFDLVAKAPGEWWAVLRPETAGTERGVRSGRPEIGEGMMDGIRNLRLAARALARRPGFTVVAILTLALGIGANVAIFSIVDAVLLRPLPYEDSERLVEVRHHAPGLGLPELNNSPGLVRYYRENAPFYESIAAFGRSSANLTGGDEATRVTVVPAEPALFDVLRVQPVMGRPFNPDDAGPESEHTGGSAVILSWHTWRGRFGADPGILGRTIELDGTPVEVVGVMPDGFGFPDDEVDLYRSLWVDPDGNFGEFGLNTISRLAPDVTVEAAQARTTDLIGLMTERFELTPSFLERSGFSVSVATRRDRVVADVESTLWIILGTVAFVLLIACANVANLFLVRAESRQKEMAIRAAMGAGRRTVASAFLGESLLLGLGGGVVGVLFALGGVEWLLALGDLPRAEEVRVGASSLLLALALSVVAGLSFGAIPLTRYAGSRFAAVLRDGGRANTAGRERHRARNLLVAAQLALGLVLLVGSGLMLRSFVNFRAVDVGIRADGVMTMGLNRNRGEDPAISARFFQEAADRVAALPGVERVGITTHLPLASGNSNGGSFYIESQPREPDELPPVALYRAVGPDYFESLAIPIVEGRSVERADWEEARRVVWVNQRFADAFFEGDAIGERVAWGAQTDENGVALSDTPWAEIVGIVADVREFGMRDEDLRPSAYFPLVVDGPANVEVQTGFLTIRVAEGQDPNDIVPAARAAIREIGPGVPVTSTRTMEEVVAGQMESVSATIVVLAVATLMALFLGAIGLAGVISYVVGQRTREIGVRVALGAQATDVSRMILRQSLTVTAAGTILGLLGAYGLTGLLEAVLFDVSTKDPVTFAGAPLVLVTVSVLATLIPVRKAARVDPIEALRSE